MRPAATAAQGSRKSRPRLPCRRGRPRFPLLSLMPAWQLRLPAARARGTTVSRAGQTRVRPRFPRGGFPALRRRGLCCYSSFVVCAVCSFFPSLLYKTHVFLYSPNPHFVHMSFAPGLPMPAPKERSSSSRDKPDDNEESSSDEESSAEEARAEETTRGLKPKAKAGPSPVPEERVASVLPVPGHKCWAEPKEPPKQVVLVPDEPDARRNRSRERRGRSRQKRKNRSRSRHGRRGRATAARAVRRRSRRAMAMAV